VSIRIVIADFGAILIITDTTPRFRLRDVHFGDEPCSERAVYALDLNDPASSQEAKMVEDTSVAEAERANTVKIEPVG
jgi:hypothetical protein